MSAGSAAAAWPASGDAARLQQERDLYLRLLEIGQQQYVEPFLNEALRLIVDVAKAERGYIALGHRGDDMSKEHRWSLAYCCTDEQVADIRKKISTSIIAEAIETTKTIQTPSAILDPAFGHTQSVRLNRIEAVLCAPVGRPFCVGVVYLQGHIGGGAFPEEVQHIVELFATHLAPLVDRVVDRKQSEDAMDHTRAIRAQLRADGLIGRSRALAAVLHEIKVVAPKRINVLITGEPGSGKSSAARAIHDNSPRAHSGRFVRIDCGELDDQRFRIEMFGALDGPHRAAGESKAQMASGGTLFLDEVDKLSLSAQAELLHFIQHDAFDGAGQTPICVSDVRIISATDINMQAAIAQRRFRDDLYYRLVGMPIHMPSLCDRLEDLPLLIEHFCRTACKQHGMRLIAPSANAYEAIEVVDWRGSVRQLASVVERAVLRADAARAHRLEPHHLFPERAAPRTDDVSQLSFQDATREFQKRYLERLLQQTRWNVTETARRANLARTYLHKLINVLGLQRPEP